MMTDFLPRDRTGLLIVDVQEKLLPTMEQPCNIVHKMHQAVQGFQILDLPICVTEQYPEGLGLTIAPLQVGSALPKTSFSCLGDPKARKKILEQPVDAWVVMGLEAHVCVLQTVKDLLANGRDVVVLNDAMASRSIYDYSTAIAEMRDVGARISSTETVLFELLRDAKAPEFKQISELVKQSSCASGNCC